MKPMHIRSLPFILIVGACALFLGVYTLFLGASIGWTYPLNGYPDTGILRLEGFRLAQEGKVKGIRLYSGGLLQLEQVDLRLLDRQEDLIPDPDPEFTKQVE